MSAWWLRGGLLGLAVLNVGLAVLNVGLTVWHWVILRRARRYQADAERGN